MSQQKPLQYVVKSNEPEYITKADDFTGPHGFSDDPRFALRQDFIEKTKGEPAVRGCWRCPHCKMQFYRRKACEMHMGLRPNLPAHCKVLLALDEARRGRTFSLELTIYQYIEAMACADRRQLRAIALGRVGQNQQKRAQALFDNQIGCLGERANLVRLGLPLSVMDYYPDDLREESGGEKPADYGDHDVKATRKGGRYLLVRRQDKREHVFIAVSAALCELDVNFDGWAPGQEVMRTEYWGDPMRTGRPPCFWYPYEKLHPMNTLPEPKVDKKNSKQ